MNQSIECLCGRSVVICPIWRLLFHWVTVNETWPLTSHTWVMDGFRPPQKIKIMVIYQYEVKQSAKSGVTSPLSALCPLDAYRLFTLKDGCSKELTVKNLHNKCVYSSYGISVATAVKFTLRFLSSLSARHHPSLVVQDLYWQAGWEL